MWKADNQRSFQIKELQTTTSPQLFHNLCLEWFLERCIRECHKESMCDLWLSEPKKCYKCFKLVLISVFLPYRTPDLLVSSNLFHPREYFLVSNLYKGCHRNGEIRVLVALEKRKILKAIQWISSFWNLNYLYFKENTHVNISIYNFWQDNALLLI